MVDPAASSAKIVVELHLTETTESEPQKLPGKRRKYRRWFVLALVPVALIWLNGPGLRWLAPKVAGHFMGKSGMRGSFSLEGSLTGGVSVHDLHLESDGALERLVVDRVVPKYELAGLIKGKVNGLEVHGVHADLRLGVTKDEEVAPAEPKEPLDFDKIVTTIRSVREKVIPLAIDLTDISLNATRDGKPVIQLAKSKLVHVQGGNSFNLELGEVTDANGRVWPSQKSEIVWNADDLSINQVDPLPGVGIRNLLVRMPENGGPSAETEMRIDDAVFMLEASPGLSSVRVDLREGRLPSAPLVERFGIKIPVSAELTSLSVNVEQLLPDPKAAIGEVRLLLENVVSGDWTVPELSLDVDLEAGQAVVAASGKALETAFSLNAGVPLTRTDGKFIPGDISGKFEVTDVPRLLKSLSDRVKSIDPEALVPASSVNGDFVVAMENTKPKTADVSLVLKPADPKLASPVKVEARWAPDAPVSTKVELDGLSVDGEYDIKESAYRAGVDFDRFTTARVDRWLAVVKADTKGAVSLTGKWSGRGELTDKTHRGVLALSAAEVIREGMAPVNATGSIEYDWPSGFSTRELQLRTGEQSVAMDAKLADGLLELSNLVWRDGQTEMTGGTARIPVPDDFSKWREMLSSDKRPVSLKVESKVLSLALLKDWLPAAAKLDPRSTAMLRVDVSGTYAEPVVDAVLEVKDLRSPEQPKLPPADLKFTVSGKEGRLVVDGSALAPDFPAAVLTASMPFRPSEWANSPEVIKSEKISARLDLPRIDLARFSSLVAAAEKVSGVLTGNVEVSGEVGKPVIKGRIDLTNGGVVLKDRSMPAITGAGLSVDATPELVKLSGLKASVAGGTLQGGGSLAIDQGKPGNIDLRITGNHLPLKRDESLIVRANADLRLAGTWERADLTGNIAVVDSLFYRDIELIPIGTPFTAPSAAALPKIDAPANPASSVPEPFRNWGINVSLVTGNPFLIRGNFAKGQVDVKLKVGGTVGNPAPDGEVLLSDIRAELPFSTLTVKRGTLRFSPANGFDPVLEIRGNAEPRPYRVTIYAYGKASNPQLVLTSNPPLPENEIMTLLATGTTTSGLEDPQAASSRAMQLLAEELRRGRFGVGKRLRPLLGLLDRVDFSLAEADPYSNDSFSTATLSITDRWFLSAGMGAEGDSRVMGIWRLTFR